MRYQIDRDLLEKGLHEALKVKINNLELKIGEGIRTDINAALNEYCTTEETARSFGIDTGKYNNLLLEKEKELKDRWGIQIK